MKEKLKNTLKIIEIIYAVAKLVLERIKNWEENNDSIGK